MAFLEVRFEDDRPLIIGGKEQGRTNIVIELVSGYHTVSIKGPPFNFSPDKIEVKLKRDRTSLDPEVIEFDKI